jgi:hypothetical protein
MFIPSNRLRSVLRWLAGSDGDHVGYLKNVRSSGNTGSDQRAAERRDCAHVGHWAPSTSNAGNEGRNGFRFIGRKAVIAAGDNMQLGFRHAAFEMEPNANRADRNRNLSCARAVSPFGIEFLALPERNGWDQIRRL